jgi:hypothetical protein
MKLREGGAPGAASAFPLRAKKRQKPARNTQNWQIAALNVGVFPYNCGKFVGCVLDISARTAHLCRFVPIEHLEFVKNEDKDQDHSLRVVHFFVGKILF